MGCKAIHEVRFIKDYKDMLNQTTKLYGKRPAYKIRSENPEEYRIITHKDFRDEVYSFGTGLLEMNYSKKRIAVISENRYEWGVTYLAATCSDGIIVPLDKSLPESEIESLLYRSEAEVVVYSQKYDEIMSNIRKNKKVNLTYISMDLKEDTENVLSYKRIVNIGSKILKNGDKRFEEIKVDNKKMSIMLFTSGTTDKSKAVMLSQFNICSNLMDIASVLEVNENDLYLSFLPLHHTFECTTGFLYSIYKGACIAFCDGLRHIQDNMKEYHITCMVSVPVLYESIYKRIMKNIQKQGKEKKVKRAIKVSNFLLKFGIDIRKIVFKDIHEAIGGKQRLFISGAAELDKEVEKGYNSFGIRVAQGYGLTETSPVLSCGNDNSNMWGSVGKPLPNIEIKIEDKDENGIGEIVARGPSIMLGYYNEDSKDLDEGWFHTGDLGYLNKDGFLFISGRKKNVIVLKNGKNVFPEEIENLLKKSEFIDESLVYGRKEDDDYVSVCAKIVYNKTFIEKNTDAKSEKEIKDLIWKEVKKINKQMPTYKYIKDITVTSEPLIKTTTQKVKRFEEMKKTV